MSRIKELDSIMLNAREKTLAYFMDDEDVSLSLIEDNIERCDDEIFELAKKTARKRGEREALQIAQAKRKVPSYASTAIDEIIKAVQKAQEEEASRSCFEAHIHQVRKEWTFKEKVKLAFKILSPLKKKVKE